MYKNLNCDLVGISGRQSEIIELALTYGFEGVDIDIQDLVKRCERTSFESAARFLLSSKLKVGCFDIPIDLDTDDASFAAELSALAKASEIAGRVQASAGILSIPAQTDRLPYPEYFEVIRQRIDQIVEVFQRDEIDVALAIQPIVEGEEKSFKFIRDIEGLAVLFNWSTKTKLVLDTWTWFCAGGTPEDLSKFDLQRVVAVRLADCTAGVAASAATNADCQLPGISGTIDCAAYLRELSGAGLNVPVSARGTFASVGGKRDAFMEKLGEQLHEALVSGGLPSQLRKPVGPEEPTVASNSPA